LPKNMILIRNLLFIIVIIPVLAFILYLAYISLTDYRPKEKTAVISTRQSTKVLPVNSKFSVTTFNIGYCGLDSDQDFFMDGGRGSGSASQQQTLTNLSRITDFLKSQNSDFILIQEMDRKAKRSFYLDQLTYIAPHFPDHNAAFTVNYKAAFVPVPLSHPMGSVLSGLASFSSYKADSWTRYQYPGGEAWPRQLFELDRCFLEARIPVNNGKMLVLINSHLSAFDKGGKIRKLQLQFLKEHIMAEYQNGNYVIVGGDWNHSLPGTDPGKFPHKEALPFWLQDLPADFTPAGFKWACDPKTPTVRTNARPYREGINYTAIIDGFLVSPNVEVVSVQGHQLHFANSDHNPVTAEFKTD
jgi:endonuclease/exonuclease/phosphatase family metal-dependent hydrolase